MLFVRLTQPQLEQIRLDFPQIPALDTAAMEQAQQTQDKLVKPKGALGKLEKLSIQLSGMTGKTDWYPGKRVTLLFAGDHGVMAHQVSTVPASVTAYMVGQFLDGKAAVNSLVRQMGARLVVVDAGVDFAFKPRPRSLVPPIGNEMTQPTFVQRKIAKGTGDFTQKTAMSPEQAQKSLELGMSVVKEEMKRGIDILFLGEMGIGNTTSASAIISAITGAPVADVTGHGSGIDEATYQRKISLIESALKLHAPADIDTLMKLGGFEIGALAGAMLYAASLRIPLVIDGLICTAAALIAHQLNPDVKNYLIAGHLSMEKGHRIVLDYLGLDPLLNLEMRLGEATGALLAYPLIESAMRTLNEMGALDVG